MKKRTLKKYQYSYGGLTVTDLNKYQGGGTNNTGAAVSSVSTVANAIAPGAGAAIPILDMMSKATSDEYGAPDSGLKGLHNRANPLANINRIMEGKDVGRSLLGLSGVGLFSEATGLSKAMFGKSDYDIEAEKREAEKKNKETYTRMNTSENWGNAGVNTSTNMMFPNGGMVLNYDDPNANAELELQETFQMPDGTVGNVDGPSHEMGGIAVDLPEGTRIWSDKLKHNGKTFAKHTKPITNKIARLEKEIAKSPNNSEAKENSIALLNQQLDYYFDTQETNKQNTEMKRTLREGGMIKRADGSYSKRGLWDNIRANKGSGKKPTAEMLKQERKIRANEKAMGGYMYAEGGINNPGFRALPEEVQENILANMGMGGEMYSLGGRLMNTPMYAEGGKLPEGVLKSRLEAHMSPEEADEYLSEYGKGGYTVRRSSDRKGKTHVVIGPDGTKKYFGDPNLGERGKSKYGKEAFYARHKKNLAGNPYFRAYARATWEEGGTIPKNTLGLTGDYSRSNTPQNILSNYNLKADYARRFGDFNAGLNANLGFENTLPMNPEEVSVMRPNANIGVNLNYERPTSNFGTTFNYNPLNQDINANLTYRKRFAEGGIHIKPENKGKFTAYAKSHGKGVQEMAAHIMANKEDYSPTIVKRANFAKNAAGWKHADGGIQSNTTLQTLQNNNQYNSNFEQAIADNEGLRQYIKSTSPGSEVQYAGSPDFQQLSVNNAYIEDPIMKNFLYERAGNKASGYTGKLFRMGGYLPMHQDGDMVGNPNRVAIGAMNPRTRQPYTMDDVAAYTQMEDLMPTPFGKEYGGARKRYDIPGVGSSYGIMEGNYDKTVLPVGYSKKMNYAQSTLTPNEPFNQLPEGVRRLSKFNLPAFGSNTNQYIAPENLTMDNVGAPSIQKPSMIANRPISQIGNTPTPPMPQRAGTGNYGEFYLPKRGQAYTDAVVENSPVTREEIQQANAMGNFPTGVNNPVNPETTPETPGFFNKAGQFIQNNPGLVGQLGTALATAGIQSARVNRLARPRTLADVRLRENVANPNLVDYSAERNAIDRTALNAMGEAQRGFGSSAAAQAFKNKARLNQLEGTGRSFQGQENANTQIRNQFLAARQEAAMREAMMNNEIDKYNLENVYGFDTMTTAQKNAITAMLGNTAGQTFGKQTDYANQLQQANILANQYDPSVLNDMIKNGKLKVVDGQIVRARNGGMIQYAEGGEVNPYKRSLNKVVNFNTSKAAETMDAEYAAAMAANQDKYTSSVTGLDYKVIKTLPKNEKRALVMDMWRDTHGEAPTQKQIESGVKAIEGKKVSSAKAKEVANVANSQESMQDMISKKWPTGTYIPTAPEPEGPSMMERGEQFYEEQIVPAARTLKKNFKEGVEKGYGELKDAYGKAKTMGKKAYASLENAEYPDVAAGSRMDIRTKGEDAANSLPLPITMLSRDLFSKIKDRTITEKDLTKGELETLKMTLNGVKKATGRDYLKYADYDSKKGTKMSNLDLIREIVTNSDNQNLKYAFGQGNFRQEGDSTIFEDTYNFNDRNNQGYMDNVSNRLAKGDNALYAPFRALGTTYGSPEGQGNKVRVAMYNPKGKRSLKK